MTGGFAALTPREREILRAYSLFGTQKRMAYELGVALQTVKNHITSILAKLDCGSCGQAALLFDRWERGLSWPDVDQRSRRERRNGDRRKAERRTRRAERAA